MKRRTYGCPDYLTVVLIIVYFACNLYFCWRTDLGGIDFTTYYVASKLMQHGTNFYNLDPGEWNASLAMYASGPSGGPLTYPPLLLHLLTPLTRLPLQRALVVWRLVSVGALFMATLGLSRLVSRNWMEPWVLLIMGLWMPAYATLYTGQVNAFILLSVVLFLLLGRWHNEWAADLALSLGLMVKPLALPLLLLIIWQRNFGRLWRLLLAIGAVTSITMSLIGVEPFWQYLRTQQRTPNFSLFGPLGTYPQTTQSLFGFFARALTTHSYGPSIANLPWLARELSLLGVAMVIFVIALSTWPHNTQLDNATMCDDRFILESALILTALPLIEPFGEYHHVLLSVIAFVTVLARTQSVATKIGLAGALGLVDVQGLLWHHFIGLTPLLSLGTYGLVVMFWLTAQELTR